MSDDLYFVPIIALALEQKNPEDSLRQALNRINMLGRRPQYERGYRQFEWFMDTVKDHMDKEQSDLLEASFIRTLIIELAAKTFEGDNQELQTTSRLIHSHPRWRKEYTEIAAELEQLNERPLGIGISIYHANEPFTSVTFTEIPSAKTIEGIDPGSYHISLATGRLIWEGEFAEQDLIWTRAFPGRPLKLAADTLGKKAVPTQQILALDGEIVLCVFAGLENGRLEIALKASGGP